MPYKKFDKLELKFDELQTELSNLRHQTNKFMAAAFLPLFFDMVNDILVIIDPQGNFVQVSRSFTVELGWEAVDVEGMHFLQFVYEKDQSTTSTAFVQYNFESDSGLRAFYYNRYKHKDGSYRWLEWVPDLKHAFDETGFILGVARVIKDSAKIAKLEEIANGVPVGDINNEASGSLSEIRKMIR